MQQKESDKREAKMVEEDETKIAEEATPFANRKHGTLQRRSQLLVSSRFARSCAVYIRVFCDFLYFLRAVSLGIVENRAMWHGELRGS